MDAYQQFKTVVYHWMRNIGVCLGLDILRRDFRPTWYTAFTIMVEISRPILCALTAYHFDGEIGMKATACLGITIKTALKMTFMLINRNRLVESMEFLCQIYEQNEKTAEHRLDFHRFARILMPVARWQIAYMLGMLAASLTLPLISYICSGSHQMILPILLPGMSLDSNVNYALHLLIQAIMVNFAVLAHSVFDFLFIVQLLHVILMTDILRHKVRAISEISAVNSRASHFEIFVNLRNVINLHNEVHRYMAGLQDLYYYPFAIIVALSVGSIGYRIYAILTMEAAMIFLYLANIIETLELAYYCAMGTMVDVFYDRFYDELLACKCYQLPLKEQKAFILLLNAAKEPNNLNVAGIMPLNVNTFMIMVNRIYSFVMILRNTI